MQRIHGHSEALPDYEKAPLRPSYNLNLKTYCFCSNTVRSK